MDRTDVEFLSGSQRCAAWLYRPDGGPETVPLVVLGHGLGLNREAGLDKYARRFVAAGMAAMIFDYRHFGASEGEPRQLLDIKKQREDWHAAISYARDLPGIDPHRIALWGSSFGGGHVLTVAHQDPTVAAVVAQCPFTDGIASAIALGPVSATKVTLLALADTVGSFLGRPPIKAALAGRPGQAALMAADDVVPGYGRLARESPLYQPDVAARIGLHVVTDAPGRAASDLTMPVFFAVCDKDTVAPAEATVKAASRLPNAVVKRYPVGHFDIYYDDAYETAVADQTQFLVDALHP
ncbi:alpha/beta hydrolase [Antrihabitans cavernicola]|uniref:Alpha/beta fold hydrolase n=1 Tax=Antrihabitans cavernicola TaxID=2495913 RepID=A0A5A7SFN8_9NOCA|nr:alpha/beta fold hydrolase [Spelaeibacter cavernicola]KAA0023061.1 alpha/beta fold hydrolase [Spelaeibacter cavernicola]